MDKKVVTYSLLAHINNQTKGESNFENIFIPLVKRGLSKMCASGQFKGNDLSDIKKHVDELYGLNMPDTVLKKILTKIEREINTKEKTSIKFYAEGSFIIDQYIFEEYEEEINKKNDDLDRLQRIYSEFLKAEGNENTNESIFDFIEQNKLSLGKYIHKKYVSENHDNITAAKFVNFIKSISDLYGILQSVYIGSIISTYLEYQPCGIKKNVELVLDTNFIISLLDLNTKSSASNCQRLLEIAEKLGYKFTVLAITLKEVDQLLKVRVDYFDTAFLSKQVDPEDIYNACERRGISKTDLDYIRSNISAELQKLKIDILSNTDKYENKAKFSIEYEKLLEKRNTKFAALHDATCIEYVKEKRGKPIYEFDKVNCWCVNNSSSPNNYYSTGFQPFIIKAEDMLNLLWLTSPMVKANISSEEFSTLGLSRTVSVTLDDSLPNASTIRRLDENLQKYANGVISDEDVVRVGKGIAERTIKNLDSLNDLADADSKKFVESLQNIANNQKKKEEEYKQLFERLIKDVKSKTKILHEKTTTIDQEILVRENKYNEERLKYLDAVEVNSELAGEMERIRSENRRLQNEIRNPLREKFIRRKILWWRFKSFLLVLAGIILLFSVIGYVIYLNDWDLKVSRQFIDSYLSNIIVSAGLALASIIYSGFFIKVFADRYNQSAVNAFKSNIIIPDNLREIQ